MGYIINSTDFVGRYAIPQNTFSRIDTYITQFEKNYLYELLGKVEADAFIADLSAGVPQAQKYINIFNALSFEYGCETITNEGMKNMMLGFIYWEYHRHEKVKSTIAGTVVNSNENSREAGFTEFPIYKRYNDSVYDHQVIQLYISQNSTTYPDYSGQPKTVAHWSI